MIDSEHHTAASRVQQLSVELRRFAPFAQMAADDVEAFITLARESSFSAGEAVLQPTDGPVSRLLFLRRGTVAGGPQGEDAASSRFVVEAGELFPVAAWLGRRAVSAPYTAVDDCLCLEVPAEAMRQLVQRSAVLADFLHSQVQHVLALSRQAQKVAFASQALAEQSMEARLGSLPRRALVSCGATTPLLEVLQRMQQRRVGSVLVLDTAGAALGIFTRHDVLERVALAQPPMDTPIERLMTRPVHALDVAQGVQDAVLLMSRQGVRHVPVTEHGRVVAMVSERDLFSLQRLSLRRLSGRLREAADLGELIAAAPDIRRLAQTLMAQGLSARTLTELVSHLNDVLTERAVQLVARQHRLDLHQACWLAFGSEGRSEQTIATDQDNGLVLRSARPDRQERSAWLAMGRQVNETLDACGYPLCKGGIMAGQPDCCLGVDEWIERFGHWIEHGAPEDLLKASIYFDFRPLAGDASLSQSMREFVQRAAQLPRFTRQMAQNALRNAPRLNWRGALDPQREGAHEWIDLKLHGTMIFVDAARLYALAQGVEATGTRARLEAVAAGLHVEARESETWIGAFEFLQMLRLRVQASATPGSAGDSPNRLDLRTLNDIDRRILKESFRAAQRLQQRVTLDYMR